MACYSKVIMAVSERTSAGSSLASSLLRLDLRRACVRTLLSVVYSSDKGLCLLRRFELIVARV
jgi:hypothetical protein